MIALLTAALTNFIMQNYLDQARILGLQPSIYMEYAMFACNMLIVQFYVRRLKKRPADYLNAQELEITSAALMLDPLWRAEIFKQGVEFYQLGGLGIFLVLNALLGGQNEFYAMGLVLLGVANPIMLLLVFALFHRHLGQIRQLGLASVFCAAFFVHKYALEDLSLSEFMARKAREFWLYEKLRFTRFSPYYTLICALLIAGLFFLRNRRLPGVSQGIYKLAIICIVLKSMSLYQFDSCILQGIFYALPLINKNLYFIPIYSSFVFLVVYPKLLQSYKLGIVLTASYLLYLGLLWLLADFYKIRIFRQQKLLIFAFFAIPITIVVFSMFGRVLVLKILQESFELLYLLIVFVVVLVVFAVDRGAYVC